MKKISTSMPIRTLVLILLFLGLGSFNAFSQKDILLYSTDFTDWGAINVWTSGTTVNDLSGASVGSDDDFAGTGGGVGFNLSGKPAVSPTGVIGGSPGYLFFGNSSAEDPHLYMTFPSLEFLTGGVLELTVFANTTSERIISIDGATQISLDQVPADVTRFDRQIMETTPNGISGGTLNTSLFAGNKIKFRAQSTGIYKMSFYFPTTYTGPKVIKILETDGGDDSNLQSVFIKSIKVYTNVGSVLKYVASTNYGKAPADGHIMTGTVAGAAYSGVPSNAKVKVKLWNNNPNDVLLTLEGADAAKFSFSNTASQSTLTIPNAQVASPLEKTIDIYFTPSIKVGVANALLKIESPGVAQPYYVSLSGLTGGGAPQLVADTATLPFWTSLIANKSQTIDIAGLNLTGNVTLSVTGADAPSFTLSTNTITQNDALAGTSLTITYQGDILAGIQNANLVISSTGASPITIPLKGITSDLRPTLHKLAFKETPTGSAYITTSPGGTEFLDGTVVTVIVEPETGYKVDAWSDQSAVKKTTRTFTVSSSKNTDNGTPILISLIVGTQVVVTDPTGNLVGYIANNPAGNDDALELIWSTVPGATSYTVELYDISGTTLLNSFATPATTYTVDGLTLNTFYTYKVKTSVLNTSTGLTENFDSGIVGPFKTNGPIVTYPCGQP